MYGTAETLKMIFQQINTFGYGGKLPCTKFKRMYLQGGEGP